MDTDSDNGDIGDSGANIGESGLKFVSQCMWWLRAGILEICDAVTTQDVVQIYTKP